MLLDTFDKDNYGGTGKAFDWTILRQLKANKKYFVAGGINIDNVKELFGYSPYCIDVSSSVETNGVKDPEKIKKIVETVRSCK